MKHKEPPLTSFNCFGTSAGRLCAKGAGKFKSLVNTTTLLSLPYGMKKS
jgi:hypothetical protein